MATTTAPAATGRVLKAVLAGLVLTGLLIGPPLLLTAYADAPWTWDPDWARVRFALQWPPTETAIRYGIAVVAWPAWLAVAIAIIRDTIVAALDPHGAVRGTGPTRILTAALVGGLAATAPAWSANAETTTVVTVGTEHGTGHHDSGQATAATTGTDDTFGAAGAGQATDPESDAATVAIESSPDGDETVPQTGHRMHTVTSGESLWQLAERYLGDGARYTEIFELNQGRDLGGGGQLSEPWTILPGWTLLIPEAETMPAIDEATGLRVVTVGPQHPTLWDIAEKYLGDPTRYMEIFELNKDRTFTGGPFDDPAEINDGWQLLIPDNPTNEQTSPTDEEAPAETEIPPETGDDLGNDSVVPDPAETPPASTEPPSTEQVAPEPADDEPTTPDGTEDHGSDIGDLVPLGVWLTAGTCLAGVTVIAIAARFRARRRIAGSTSTAPDDEPLTGRLSDLESIIELEARKLAEPTPTNAEYEEPKAPIAVDADRDPVELADLAGAGIGLLGPGQHAAARASIIAAATAKANLHLTEAAKQRIEIDQRVPAVPLSVFDTAKDAIAQTDPDEHSDTVLVCADTDIDDATSPAIDRFLTGERGSAIILGHWERAALTLDADGTVQRASGDAAEYQGATLHIADPESTTVILDAVTEPESTPEPTEETDNPVVGEVAAGQDPPQGQTSGGEGGEEAQTKIRLCLFGTPSAYVDDQPVAFKKGKRALRLLAVLALADEAIGLSELLNGVVDDQYDRDKAKNNLNTIGSATRVNLRAATSTRHQFYRYDHRTETYELEHEHFTTDVAEFDRHEQEAALAADEATAAQSLEAAVALYTGDLAPGVDTASIRQLRDQYRTAAIRACRKLADHHRDQGDPALADHYQNRASTLDLAAPE